MKAIVASILMKFGRQALFVACGILAGLGLASQDQMAGAVKALGGDDKMMPLYLFLATSAVSWWREYQQNRKIKALEQATTQSKEQSCPPSA